MNLREAAQQALEALEMLSIRLLARLLDIETVASALEQPAPKPAAWASPVTIPLRGLLDNHPCVLTATRCASNTVPLYTVPPDELPR